MPPRLPATDRCRSTRGYTLAHAPQHAAQRHCDVLPDQAARWLRVEAVARDLAERYAFERVDTPLFERIELFARSAGKSSDLVEKEMFRVSGATGSDEERAEAGAAARADRGHRARLHRARHARCGPAGARSD